MGPPKRPNSSSPSDDDPKRRCPDDTPSPPKTQDSETTQGTEKSQSPEEPLPGISANAQGDGEKKGSESVTTATGASAISDDDAVRFLKYANISVNTSSEHSQSSSQKRVFGGAVNRQDDLHCESQAIVQSGSHLRGSAYFTRSSIQDKQPRKEYDRYQGKDQTTAPKKQEPSRENENTLRNRYNHDYRHPMDAEVIIHFHVVIPPTFRFNPACDHIFLMGSVKHLGSWKQGLELLTEAVGNGFHLVQGKHSLPLHVVASVPEYKYVVFHPNGMSTWEYIVNHKGDHEHNRHLVIPNADQIIATGAEWHQYDCCMQPEPAKPRIEWYELGKWFTSDRKALENFRWNAESSINILLPKWRGFQIAGPNAKAHEVAQTVIQVMTGVEKQVHNSLLKPDVDAPKRILRDMLRTAIMCALSATEGSLRLASAVTIGFLAGRYDLNFDLPEVRVLLKCLALPVDSDTQGCPLMEETLIQHFDGGHRRELIEAVEYAIKLGLKTACVEVFQVLPLFHFLSESSKPFGVHVGAGFSCNVLNSKSWGFSEDVQASLKLIPLRKAMEKQLSSQREETMKQLKELAVFDGFIPYCVAVSIPDSRLELLADSFFPLDACVGRISVLLKESFHKFPQHEKAVTSLINHLMSQGVEVEQVTTPARIKAETQRTKTALALSAQFLSDLRSTRVITELKYFRFMQLVVLLVLECHTRLRSFEKHLGGKNFEKECRQALNRVEDIVFNWISQKRKVICDTKGKLSDDSELPMWASFFKMTVRDPELTTWWKDCLHTHLRRRVNDRVEGTRIALYCENNTTSLHSPEVEAILENEASSALAKLLEKKEYDIWKSVGSKAARLLSKVFVEHWSSVITDRAIFEHSLEWKAMAAFLAIHTSADNTKQEDDKWCFTTECREKLDKAISVFRDHLQNLNSGEIPLDLVKRIIRNRLEFVKLAGILSLSEHIPNLLDRRQQEIEAFEQYRVNLARFVEKCKELAPELGRATRELEAKMRTQISDISFCEIVQPVVQLGNENIPIQVTYFGPVNHVQEAGKMLGDFGLSVLFMRSWELEGQEVCKQIAEGELIGPVTLDVLHQFVWSPALEQWRTLHSELQSQTIKLTELEDVLKDLRRVGKDTSRQWKEEFRFFENSKKTWISKTVKTIENYVRFDRYLIGAQAFMDLQVQFSLSGDFSVIQQILELGSSKAVEHVRLRDISDDLVRAGEAIKGITDQQVLCIAAIAKTKDFVDWVRTEIENTTNLKAFVEVASTSVEGDWEEDRLSTLNTVVMAYSGIIFDLAPNTGFQDLYTLCQRTWTAHTSLEVLVKMLEDISLLTDWLKRKNAEARDSVEKTAVRQVQMINDRGVYQIGCFDLVHKQGPW